MRTNKWNLARCHLCGFHFEPDMHMCVIAATREIPYCAHGATMCACCNTNGFLTTFLFAGGDNIKNSLIA